MKFKNGLDLCGFALTNFCIQGLESMPSDAALGRKYFHTNATDDVATGISLLNRERIYLGEGAWRATAYLDDIAAINEKLNLITGDTDTDTLINNLKDLEEFLKDFSETDKLKSLLDGKLDKSGGTITSAITTVLTINTTYGALCQLLLQDRGANKARFGWGGDVSLSGYRYGAFLQNVASESSIGVKDDGTPYYNNNTLIHSGNIGSYAMTRNNVSYQNAVNDCGYALSQSGWPYNGPFISFGSDASYKVVLHYPYGLSALRCKVFNNSAEGSDWKTIAFTDSNVASATKLQTARTIWGQSFDGTGDVRGSLSLGDGYIRGGASSVNILYYDNSNTLYLGYGMNGVGGSVICGNAIAMRYGDSRTMGFVLNSSGNVTIGGSDLAGANAKLYVDNNTAGSTALGLHVSGVSSYTQALGSRAGWAACIGRPTYGLLIGSNSSDGSSLLQVGRLDNTDPHNMALQPLGGNVLVGATSDDNSGAKLQVNGLISSYSSGNGARHVFVGNANGTVSLYAATSGNRGLFDASNSKWMVYTDGTNVIMPRDVHITGNLIVDGEVSAGGAAAEEEGTSGSGSVDFHSEDFTPSTSTTYQVNHNLGKKVIVQVYEQGATSENWNLVMVDVEIISATRLDLRFGKTETTPHRVVVMGAGV